MPLGQRAMQAHEARDAWVERPRDGRELSIVEPHVNIGASLSFERRGFLVQRLKRMGGAGQRAQRRRA
jgi:hypothetical protein